MVLLSGHSLPLSAYNDVIGLFFGAIVLISTASEAAATFKLSRVLASACLSAVRWKVKAASISSLREVLMRLSKPGQFKLAKCLVTLV